MAALREAEAQLEARNNLVEDLENQLRTTGDASTVRELNHQLRQMVLVHRQLLRKVRLFEMPFRLSFHFMIELRNVLTSAHCLISRMQSFILSLSV